MSKIGVGVGEDFPVDDSKQPARDWDKDDDRRRRAYVKWREEHRAWKRHWRNEWRARRNAFREEFHASNYASRGSRRANFWESYFLSGRGLLAIFALIGIVAIIGFALSHIFVLIGLVAIGAMIIAYNRGFDPFDLPHANFGRHEQPAENAPPHDQTQH